ncbi:hypothetical protein ACHAQA_007748 [Verticillium albo-atrum]
MAAATQIQLPQSTPPSILGKHDASTSPADNATSIRNTVNAVEVDFDEAVRLALLCRKHLNLLHALPEPFDHSRAYTPDEILELPLMKVPIDDTLHDLPRRKSSRTAQAAAIANLLFPCHADSLSPIIRYDADRVKLHAWAVLQRRYLTLVATVKNGRTRHGLTGGAAPGVHAPAWASRILAQGPWDKESRPVSLDGPPALPMPVQVAGADELAPFFAHLEQGGTHELDASATGHALDDGNGEPYYHVQGAEFQRGVVYEDGRMDLCKQVVGPDHIGDLMDSLRPNEHVRHFLLGNNIIGPVGARHIASFIEALPDRMDTWYLAGNCIDGTSFKILVDSLVNSDAVTNIWLKRNPLGRAAAYDVFRLITEAKNLRTLDLDQTELGDAGFAELFSRLAAYTGRQLPLENLYMNGNGFSEAAARALALFLASPNCGLTSVYLSNNPIGDDGTAALAGALRTAPQIKRLTLQSTGLTTRGAKAICEALTSHPSILCLDLGQAYATQDLGQAYNYIDEGAIPAIRDLLTSTKSLSFFNLGHCPIAPPELREITTAALQSSLLAYTAISILPDPNIKKMGFVPSRDSKMRDASSYTAPTKDQNALDQELQRHMEANVRAAYGGDMTYEKFTNEERRWLNNDRTDVRKIDSVYRNRDMGLARRGLMTLIKNWKEGDDTLERVINAQGPFCCKKRRTSKVGDALVKLKYPLGGFLDRIRMYSPGAPARIFGPAVTIQMVAASDDAAPKLDTHFADHNEEGGVMYIQQPRGLPSACWGGLMSTRAKYLGAAGVVVDGRVRDVGEHNEMGFAVFAKDTSILGSNSFTRASRANVPLQFDGDLWINPGDILIGDQDGVVVTPLSLVEQVVALCQERAEMDERMFAELRRGAAMGPLMKKVREGK